MSLLFTLLLTSLLGLQAETPRTAPLQIGDTAPLTDVKMVATDGSEVSLADVAGEGGLLVIFSCNTCPWVHAWEDRYNPITEEAARHGIGTILLNPNEDLRATTESLETMRERAAQFNYAAPYVVDAQHRLADAFGATRTPEIFLFNRNMELVYHGAIDDNAREPQNIENHYLMDALRNLSAGEAITPQTTRSVGCTIKRVS